MRGKLLVKLPPEFSLDNQELQQQIRDEAIKILRRDAKKYLPPLLEELAGAHGFAYQRVRFSLTRSEERRVGKECRSRWSPYH